MNKILMTAAATCFALASAANATTVTISAFDISSFNAATNYHGFIVQDFEPEPGDVPTWDFTTGIDDPVTGAGQLNGDLNTNVGKFSALTTDADGNEGFQGSGSTCGASFGSPCDKLFLSDKTVNGQGNSVPVDGNWSLNANDTFGILWDVARGANGSLFNRVVFAIMDAADIGNTVVNVTVDGIKLGTLSGLSNAERKLIVIDFATLVDNAAIEIRSSKLNDSFSIDGASVGVVPLPAGGLLLLTGLGALAFYRRRKQLVA